MAIVHIVMIGGMGAPDEQLLILVPLETATQSMSDIIAHQVMIGETQASQADRDNMHLTMT